MSHRVTLNMFVTQVKCSTQHLTFLKSSSMLHTSMTLRLGLEINWKINAEEINGN